MRLSIAYTPAMLAVTFSALARRRPLLDVPASVTLPFSADTVMPVMDLPISSPSAELRRGNQLINQPFGFTKDNKVGVRIDLGARHGVGTTDGDRLAAGLSHPHLLCLAEVRRAARQ
jgi:hypothetical protein